MEGGEATAAEEDEDDDEEEEVKVLGVTGGLFWLFFITVFIAFLSEVHLIVLWKCFQRLFVHDKYKCGRSTHVNACIFILCLLHVSSCGRVFNSRAS